MLLVTIGLATLVYLACAVSPSACAQADPGWIGEDVVQKTEHLILLEGGRAVSRNTVEIPIYRVDQIDADGCRLKLREEINGSSGGLIRVRSSPWGTPSVSLRTGNENIPKTSSHDVMLATLWRREGEYQRAVADLVEALRLDPSSISAIWNLGSPSWASRTMTVPSPS